MIQLAEAKTISDSEKRWLKDVHDIVIHYVPDALVILYGSSARGTRAPDSDYDVVILTPNPLLPSIQNDLRNAIYDIELSHNIVLAVLFLTHNDWERMRNSKHPFWQNIMKEGIKIE